MKTYFAKYLPVEGKVEMGDKFIDTGVMDMIGTRANKKGEYNFQKVKLFLCSRDIQVGDTIYNKFNDVGIVSEFNTKTTFWLKGESIIGIARHSTGNWYKIIGEISPYAIWVKEGDEFDEDQIEISRRLKFKKGLPVLEGSSSIVWANGGSRKTCDGIYFKRSEEPRYIAEKSTPAEYCCINCDKEFMIPRDLFVDISTVKIKCSQCETFH